MRNEKAMFILAGCSSTTDGLSKFWLSGHMLPRDPKFPHSILLKSMQARNPQGVIEGMPFYSFRPAVFSPGLLRRSIINLQHSNLQAGEMQRNRLRPLSEYLRKTHRDVGVTSVVLTCFHCTPQGRASGFWGKSAQKPCEQTILELRPVLYVPCRVLSPKLSGLSTVALG